MCELDIRRTKIEVIKKIKEIILYKLYTLRTL